MIDLDKLILFRVLAEAREISARQERKRLDNIPAQPVCQQLELTHQKPTPNGYRCLI